MPIPLYYPHPTITWILRWFVRITAIYLFFWWELFSIAYVDAVMIDWDLSFLFYIKTTMFFLFPHLSIWIATMPLGRRLRWFLLFPIVATLLFNATIIIKQEYYVNVLGVAISIYVIYLLFTEQLNRKAT